MTTEKKRSPDYQAGYRAGYQAGKATRGIRIPDNLMTLWLANSHMPAEDVYMLTELVYSYRKAKPDISPAEWAFLYSAIQLAIVHTIEVVVVVPEGGR